MQAGDHVQCLLSFAFFDFNDNWKRRKILVHIPRYKIFAKSRPVGTELLDVDRRTYARTDMTNLIFATGFMREHVQTENHIIHIRKQNMR